MIVSPDEHWKQDNLNSLIDTCVEHSEVYLAVCVFGYVAAGVFVHSVVPGSTGLSVHVTIRQRPAPSNIINSVSFIAKNDVLLSRSCSPPSISHTAPDNEKRALSQWLLLTQHPITQVSQRILLSSTGMNFADIMVANVGRMEDISR